MTNPLGAIFGALKYVPATVARKALEKVNPKFKNYFSTSVAYGLDANRALDYLSDRFQSDAQRSHKQQLEQGAANNTLRPDEMVSRSQLKNAEMPANVLKSALAFGGAGALTGRESQQPPTEESASPGKGAAAPSQNTPAAPQGEDLISFLEGYSKPLARQMHMRIQQGSIPKDAALVIKHSHMPSKKTIEKIEAETHENFEDIVARMSGQAEGTKARMGDRKKMFQEGRAAGLTEVSPGDDDELIAAMTNIFKM